MDVHLLSRKWFTYVVVLTATLVTACDGRRREVESILNDVSTPMLTWGGQSTLGYVKVELRGKRSEPQRALMELRVYRANGTTFRFSGMMVELPDDLKPTGGVWQAFVHFPDEIQPYQEMIAVVTPDGALRLFSYQSPDGRKPCELRPIS